jgi:hypothetical protein
MRLILRGSLFIPSVVLITSLAITAAFVPFRRMNLESLPAALLALVEIAGLSAMFCAMNSLVGLALIDILRHLLHTFISHYLINGPDLFVLSLAQAVIARELLVR